MLNEFFNEREAIKLRLEQAHQEKVRLDEEIAQLMKRLKELDEQESLAGQLKEISRILANLSAQIVPNLKHQPENQPTGEMEPESRKAKRRQRRKNGKAKQENKRWRAEDLLPVVEEILKDHGYLCSSSDLKEELARRTGYNPANFTFLMNRIMKMDSRIQKPGRGQYVLRVPDELQAVEELSEPEPEQPESDQIEE